MSGNTGPPQRGHRVAADKKLPSIPLADNSNLLHPSHQPHHSISSSFYSQPSPEMRQGPRLDIPRASSVYPDDISPPDSPRTTGARSSSPNVSPISTSGSGFRSKTVMNPPTSIPAPVQQAHGGPTSYLSGWREKVGNSGVFGREKKTKWDTYSGEPTASEKGKTGSTSPGSTPFERPDGLGSISTIVSGGQAQPQKQSLFSATFKKGNKKEVPATKPEWKGASGRQPIIQPPTENPNAGGKSKAFPTPSQRRKQLKTGLRNQRDTPSQNSGHDSDWNVASASGKDNKSARNTPSPAQFAYGHPEEQNSRGSIVSAKPPRLEEPVRITKDDYEPSPLSRLDTDENSVHSPIVRGESMVETPDRVDTPSRGTPQFSESQLRFAVRHMDLSDEPASRFSATTYNTSVPDSPPGTPDPNKDDVPPVPVPPISVLHRKRPVPTTGVSWGSKPPPKPVSRKPTPSTSGLQQEMSDSVSSIPQQLDRVSQLEAKLASLQKKKNSNETVIHELTHVVQPSSTSYDLAARNEIKKTVVSLETENSNITREIHETGLKLHRALKKRDENSLFEPTGLWVRRVTE